MIRSHAAWIPSEPLVVADQLVLAAFPAEIEQPPGRGRERVVVCADRAAVTERSEVLARVEAEGRCGSERPGQATVERSAVSLGCVLEQRESLARGQGAERVHVADLPVEVHGEDRSGPWADRSRDRGRIDQAVVGQHIGAHRRGAGVDHGERRRDERVRRDDHHVAGADPSRLRA